MARVWMLRQVRCIKSLNEHRNNSHALHRPQCLLVMLRHVIASNSSHVSGILCDNELGCDALELCITELLRVRHLLPTLVALSEALAAGLVAPWRGRAQVGWDWSRHYARRA